MNTRVIESRLPSVALSSLSGLLHFQLFRRPVVCTDRQRAIVPTGTVAFLQVFNLRTQHSLDTRAMQKFVGHRMCQTLIVLCMIFQCSDDSVQAIEPQPLKAAISKAVGYLAVEVPDWQAAHACASCHNQGDAARALIEAHRQGFIANTLPLESTLKWLSTPNDWKNNRGAPEFNDPTLSNLHFAGTLLMAQRHWGARFNPALAEAAKMTANLQQTDGSWNTDGAELFASPITHGSILLTSSGFQILSAADSQLHSARIEKARQWLLNQRARNTLEFSSLLIALQPIPQGASQRQACLTKLLEAQGEDGGFGPYANAQSEVFDSALAVLALSTTEPQVRVELAIQKGAEYLLKMQEEAGYWNETTRPAGTESYAHRVSTTGWATQALLAVHQRLLSRDKATSKRVFEK